MKIQERRETAIVILVLAASVCSSTAAAAAAAGSALYIFSAPVVFLLMLITQVSMIPGRGCSPLFPVRTAVTAAAAAFPFLAVFVTTVPGTAGNALVIAVFFAVQGMFWAYLYAASRMVYSGTLFLGVLVPLLAYSCIAGTEGSGTVLSVSPFGFLYFLCSGKWTGYLLPAAVSHTVAAACAYTVFAFRQKGKRGTEK